MSKSKDIVNVKVETSLPPLKSTYNLKTKRDDRSTTHTKQDTINHLDDSDDSTATNPNGSCRSDTLHTFLRPNHRRNPLDINDINHTTMTNIMIDHIYLLRIAYYSTSYYPEESLSAELFNDTFGSVMGAHYFEKWQYVVNHDILKMIAYFGIDTSEGQKFCDMLAGQILKYEKRIGR